MPFKSKDQIARFREMVSGGKMTQDTFDRWMQETPNPEALPDRIGPPKVGVVKKIKTIK